MRLGSRIVLIKAQNLLTTCSRWVLDPSLTKSSRTGGTYNFNKSNTVSDMDETFFIQYGGGAVEGYVISETVTVAGLTFENVTMGIANTTAPAFLDPGSIGLLGLGPQDTYGMMSL